ncbi:cation efflux protein [Ascodesmis nigricans]|uniref:Cation efflux protein n=1 Tax=Ascodesmis nigricans TaxID=341454 RepID=A0A4S2N5M2_9PEZI|nr:cation efflux protein [Ascodesmis nigricans]
MPSSKRRTARSRSPLPPQSSSLHLHSHSHGHSHSHSHNHEPNPLLLSRDRTDPAVRITRLGLLINLLLAVSKGIGGYYFSSQALVADAFHSLTDMVSDVMTLATVSIALSPPSPRFPNGYGKVEALGSLAVSGILAIGGIGMGWSSMVHLIADLGVAEMLPGWLPHGHAHSHAIPGLGAAWLAAGSVVIKEYLYHKTMKIAKERQSGVLASNAVHHRVDSLTAVVALLAIAGSNVWPAGAGWLDPVGGLLVAGMVVRAGLENTWGAVEELADKGIGERKRKEIVHAAEHGLGVVDGVKVVTVEGVKSGQNILVTVIVEVDGTRTVGDMKDVEWKIRERVANDVKGIWRVGVRCIVKGEDVMNEFFLEMTGSSRGCPQVWHAGGSRSGSEDHISEP